MSVVFILIPLSLALGGLFVGLYLWALRAGQFSDLETPRWRLLFDEDEVKKEKKGPI